MRIFKPIGRRIRLEHEEHQTIKDIHSGLLQIYQMYILMLSLPTSDEANDKQYAQTIANAYAPRAPWNEPVNGYVAERVTEADKTYVVITRDGQVIRKVEVSHGEYL